jgi:outer membrane protein TolC
MSYVKTGLILLIVLFSIALPSLGQAQGEVLTLEEAVREGRYRKLDVPYQKMDVPFDLKTTYYEIYRLDRVLEINQENQKLFQALLESATTQYAAGKTTADPPLKAQVELSKLENEALMLEHDRMDRVYRLKELLHRSDERAIVLPSQLNWPHLKLSWDQVKKEALRKNPAIQIYGMRGIEKAYHKVLISEKIVDSFQTKLLPESKTMLESAQLAYAAGKADFLTLIDAARSYKDIRMSFYESQARFGDAYVELEALIGRNL